MPSPELLYQLSRIQAKLQAELHTFKQNVVVLCALVNIVFVSDISPADLLIIGLVSRAFRDPRHSERNALSWLRILTD